MLLRGPSTLTRGERELIAAYVSGLNDCRYCSSSHSATAAAQLPGGMALVDQVRADASQAPVSAKLRALLAIAAAACWGRHVDGSGEPRFTYGHSLLCNPWGQVVAVASDGVGWATGRAERTITDKVRRDMPVLDHRKLA